jgi:dipeptidase D
MSDAVSNLEPRSIWSHFDAITRIPRPSKHEDRILAWIDDLAAEHGWELVRDETGNRVLRVPATSGHEDAPTVVIQGHVDMVCEKNKGTEHDFLADPIRTVVDGAWVRAEGTTLGADNGIGVAAGLAAATDPDVVHGPLELLLTVDEETGLTGAKNLDAAMITGRTLLNLDSEEDGVIYVGCAGGSDVHLTLHVTAEPPAAGLAAYRLEVGGLRGGHSGLNIGENRGNAVKLLARILHAAIEADVPFQLGGIDGGDKHNAIPREAETVLFLDPDAVKTFDGIVGCMREGYAAELKGVDDGVTLGFAPCEAPADVQVLGVEGRNRLVRLLMALPHGVLAMSRDIAGLVETSSNLAAVKHEGSTVSLLTSSRSSVGSALQSVLDTIVAAGRMAEADVEVQVGYPGWQPNLDSPVLGVVRAVYEEQWSKPAEVTAIHAGLECGLIGERIPGMDMVSFGPQIEGAHSPDERVHVASVERFWNALREILARLARA